MDRQMVVDYVIALTHLYGLVHKSKVVQIYNAQKSDQITEMSLSAIQPEDLEAEFVYIQGDYFIHEAFLDKEYFEEELRARVGKPFYIPPQEELLNYIDDDYFDNEKEYSDLFDYVTKNIFPDDEEKAKEFCRHVQHMCKAAWSLPMIIEDISEGYYRISNQRQIHKMVQLIVNLANNTRLWENNGHTPRELSQITNPRPSSPTRATTASGRPLGGKEPCPCGSGKRYKRCCLEK